MKKITSFLLAGLFTASITACSQETINVPLQQTTQPNNVSTYSNEGLKSAFTIILQTTFKMFDKNKDNYVSLEEYKSSGNPAPQPAEPPPAPPSDPVTPPSEQPTPPAQGSTEQVADQIVAQSKKISIPTDATERFKKMDKNKDGKLSFTEVKNASLYFTSFQKTSLKANAKGAFEMFDKDKNKSISRDEFMAINMTNDQAGKMVQGMLFISADKNNNGSLGFSEFEDVFYNSIRAYFAGTPNTPSPAPQPVEPPPAPPADPVAPPSEQPAPPAQP